MYVIFDPSYQPPRTFSLAEARSQGHGRLSPHRLCDARGRIAGCQADADPSGLYSKGHSVLEGCDSISSRLAFEKR